MVQEFRYGCLVSFISRLTHNMPLHHLALFVYAKGGGAGGRASVPPASASTARLLGRPKSSLGRWMQNAPAGVLLLLNRPAGNPGGPVIARRPDIVRYLRNRRCNKNGFMYIHEPKGNGRLCQTAARSKKIILSGRVG